MKTIGIIGGMSAHSTALYYQKLNQSINARLGGHASARCLIMSVNFAEIEACQRNNDWQGASQILVDCAKRLKLAGAEVDIKTEDIYRFNPKTEIVFEVLNRTKVSLTIYNVYGQNVWTKNMGLLEKGSYVFPWNGETTQKKPLVSGIYFYRVSVGDKHLISKMSLIK